ncbi:hypothetical protein [Leifsonia sp. TF02-11]|uniref:hypothetical protein n=1 Tax=Leifsonia sp. TF02-11 TaxID=2815212 RepID=UPI001AA15B3B|nr:hypothetical protein [Leifsonia sp. TF02-11]MBO1739663.1 hypothetical protein [Leifsonia sp. TF02-11]
MPFAPALTASTDASPCPRVLVVFSSLAAGTQTINVYRTAEGRQFRVRGGVNLFAVGGAQVMDFECPFGVPAAYQAEQFDSNGASLGFTDTATVTLSVTRSWIHQPLSPALAVTGKVTMDSANDFVRPAPGSTEWPEGATVGRLISGRRRGLSGTQLNIKLASTSDSDTFAKMFGDYTTDFPSVLCIRTPGPAPRIPRLLFAACTSPHEVVAGINRLIVWQMTVDEVAPPAPGLILPLLRRKDIDAAFATRAARAAAYATRGARDADYTKAGLAG